MSDPEPGGVEDDREGWHCPTCGFHADDISAIWGHIGAAHKRPPKPIKHGTVAGAQAERRRKLPLCPACRKAWNRYYRQFRQGGLKNLLKERMR